MSVGLDGNYHSGTGPNPDAVGTWEWLAVYSGDANNDGTNSGCTAEPVTVTQASPGINTTATPANEVVGGGTLSDSATLTGGDSPTGTVTFYLFSPTRPARPRPRRAVTLHTSGAVSVGLDGNYHSGTGPNPDAVGTGSWLAVYSGDSNNKGANSGRTTEPVVVTAPASKGYTMGFWGNNNGHAVLDPDHNGDIDLLGVDTTFTVGSTATGLRYATSRRSSSPTNLSAATRARVRTASTRAAATCPVDCRSRR